MRRAALSVSAVPALPSLSAPLAMLYLLVFLIWVPWLALRSGQAMKQAARLPSKARILRQTTIMLVVFAAALPRGLSPAPGLGPARSSSL